MTTALTTPRPVEEMALSPVSQEDPILALISRAARDSSIDVEKMDRLLQMHERVRERLSQEQFNASMTLAQQDMRPVAADANNPQTKSRYASYHALDRALRPLYTKHGFGLSFDTGDGAPAGWVRVLCYVTHGGGFARTYHVDMPADGKGAKGGDVMTVTHAVGAAMSYGMRYLLKLIFNVAVGEDDRDGNMPADKPAPAPPAGYADWKADMQAGAGEGFQRLAAAWKGSRKDWTGYADQYEPSFKEGLKAVAKNADRTKGAQ